jgi:hypothetical protein
VAEKGIERDSSAPAAADVPPAAAGLREDAADSAASQAAQPSSEADAKVEVGICSPTPEEEGKFPGEDRAF